MSCRSFIPGVSFGLTLLFMIAVMPEARAQANGAKILQQVDVVETGAKDMTAKVRMTLFDKKGSKRIREATILQKGTDKRLFRFTAPADTKGVGVLVIGTDTIHFYLPEFRRIRRIAGHVRNDTFMGTDFTFDDMGSLRYSDSYNVSGMQDKGAYHVLTLTPKKGSKKPYKQLKMWVRKADKVFTKLEYYATSGRLQKVMTRGNIRRHGKYYLCHRVEMRDARSGHRTRMDILNAHFDKGLPDKKFTTRFLRRS